MDIARLRRSQGKIIEAHNFLKEYYDQFQEGRDSADLKDARALLHDLRQVE